MDHGYFSSDDDNLNLKDENMKGVGLNEYTDIPIFVRNDERIFVDTKFKRISFTTFGQQNMIFVLEWKKIVNKFLLI